MTRTGSWTDVQGVSVAVGSMLNNNTIRIESSGQDFGNMDYITLSTASGTPPPPPPACSLTVSKKFCIL